MTAWFEDDRLVIQLPPDTPTGMPFLLCFFPLEGTPRTLMWPPSDVRRLLDDVKARYPDIYCTLFRMVAQLAELEAGGTDPGPESPGVDA